MTSPTPAPEPSSAQGPGVNAAGGVFPDAYTAPVDWNHPCLPAEMFVQIADVLTSMPWPCSHEQFAQVAREQDWNVHSEYHDQFNLKTYPYQWVTISYSDIENPINLIHVHPTQHVDRAPDAERLEDELDDAYVEYTKAFTAAFGQPYRRRNTADERSLAWIRPSGAIIQLKHVDVWIISEVTDPESAASLTQPGGILAP